MLRRISYVAIASALQAAIVNDCHLAVDQCDR